MKIKSLSVLLTTYNCAEYISIMIKSILRQTFSNYELIIIDDGSEDNTKEVIASFNDSRIIYERIEHCGRSKSLNHGLKNCKHEFVAIADADDICHPKRFESQLKIMSDHENTICSTWCSYFLNNKLLFNRDSPSMKEGLIKKLALHSYICHASVIYNKKFIINTGGYDENLKLALDYDLWLRLKDKANFIIIPEYLYFVRVREDSLTRNNIIEKNKIHYSIQEKYYNDLRIHFNFSKKDEIHFRGWREYFYGDKFKARKYWRKKLYFMKKLSVFLAYLITFLPDNLLIAFKELRIRYRLIYFFDFFKKEARDIRSVFISLINN